MKKGFKTIKGITEYRNAEVLVGAQVYVSMEDARQLLKLTSKEMFHKHLDSEATIDASIDSNAPIGTEVCRMYLRTMAKQVLFNSGKCTPELDLVSNLVKEYVE